MAFSIIRRIPAASQFVKRNMADDKILEGVFAVCKPPSLSSAQVLRDLQNRFRKSKIFAPLLEDTTLKKQEQERRHQSKRRRRDDSDATFKMGHGGTLDPLATGVLIVGIGRGTKTLQDFLGCTKQYDTVVLFGKSTDTYDICGKIVGEQSFDQITKEKVEENLIPFRGKIKQVPPVYSALKIDGIKAYDYARTGKELPRELESRDMVVDECTLIEYYEGGKHDFRWPVEEAAADEKAAVEKLMRRGPLSTDVNHETTSKQDQTQNTSSSEAQQPKEETVTTQPSTSEQTAESASAQPSEPSKDQPAAPRKRLDAAQKAALHTHDIPTLSADPSPAPAARIRLQVSSGFYVRSFAHDLGLSLSSYGIMAELIRTRQQKYTTISPAPAGLVTALTYDDLEAGEETWGPKIRDMLESWMAANPVRDGKDRVDDRDKPERSRNYKGPGGGKARGGRDRWESRRGTQIPRAGESQQEERLERRRNSSSPE